MVGIRRSESAVFAVRQPSYLSWKDRPLWSGRRLLTGRGCEPWGSTPYPSADRMGDGAQQAVTLWLDGHRGFDSLSVNLEGPAGLAGNWRRMPGWMRVQGFDSSPFRNEPSCRWPRSRFTPSDLRSVPRYQFVVDSV